MGLFKSLNKLLYLIIHLMYHTKVRFYGNLMIPLRLPMIAFILLLVCSVMNIFNKMKDFWAGIDFSFTTFCQTKPTDRMPITFRSKNELIRIIIYYTVVLSPTVSNCRYELHIETPLHHGTNLYLINMDLKIVKIPRKGFYTNAWSCACVAGDSIG